MNIKYNILLIEKDKKLADVMEKSFSDLNFRIERTKGGYEAFQMLKLYKFDLVILDQDLPLINSSETLKFIRKSNKHIPIIVLLDEDREKRENLLYLMKGDFDYLIKPIEFEILKEKVNNILYSEDILKEVNEIIEKIKADFGFDEIIGKSDKMIKIFQAIKKVTDSDVSVFISGESGTGKELIAREIHKNSRRKDNSFITINCAALPETLLESELFGHEKGAFTGAYQQKIGKFEYADKGTLFLDEIGEMSLPLQAKILRVIEEQEFERVGGNKTIKVNVRIISATNKKLEDEVDKGNFRKDLYYRINVYPIDLPPLRERKDDIPILVGHFIKKLSMKDSKKIKRITPEALKLLEEYPWPGNIRELENVLERAVISSQNDNLRIEDFPILSEKKVEYESEPKIEKKPNNDFIDFDRDILPMEDVEKNYLKYALKLSGGNISKTAKKLKIGRATLYRKLQKYKIINET
jgi:DNA-binding NtrC family response regulator